MAQTNAAELIFEGTIEIVTPFEWDDEEALVQVRQYFKGNGPSSVRIRGFGPATACMIEARISAHLIFFTVSDQTGTLWIRAVYPVNVDTTNQITAAAGQAPATPSMARFEARPLAEHRESVRETSFAIWILVLSLIGLITAAFLFRKRCF